MITSSSLAKTINIYSQKMHKPPQPKHTPDTEHSDRANNSNNSSRLSITDRNQDHHKNQQQEICQFKIRQCPNKNTIKTANFEGKRIAKLLLVQGKEKIKPSNSNQPVDVVIKRFSTHSPGEKKTSLAKNIEIMQLKQQPTNSGTNAFHQIDLFKPVQKGELIFCDCNMQTLRPLSHSP